MVFFNYSTMQMAAKVVYYGPGLCGKTTNLQFIYGHTSTDSRGEMVSLETETDRTLFFDLLPIDVGSIAGFNTRIQLYTVPGQVFYNTTRKLVLKGVDGVVFVADSQRPMLQANLESLKNLQINLEEMNLTVDAMPIVLQYNKRDLPDVCSIEEMERALNPHGWPSFAASAVTGQGVFETLKGISKLTLLNLKKRLSKPDSQTHPQAKITAMQAPPRPATPAAAPPVRPASPVGAAPMQASGPQQIPDLGAAPAFAPAAPAAAVTPQAAPSSPTAPPTKPAGGGPAPKALPLSPAAKHKTTQVDVLAELEKIRRQAMHSPAGAAPPIRPATPAAPLRPPAATSIAAVGAGGSSAHPKYPVLNGKGEIHRSVELTLKRGEFTRARRFLLNLRIEDEDRQVVDAIRDLPIEIQDAKTLERVLLQLNVAIKSKD
jgi:mutual gliding-motility protein MglA